MTTKNLDSTLKICEVVFQSRRPKYQSDQSARTLPKDMVYKLILLQASWYHTSALTQLISTNLHNKNHLLGTKNLANCTYYINILNKKVSFISSTEATHPVAARPVHPLVHWKCHFAGWSLDDADVLQRSLRCPVSDCQEEPLLIFWKVESPEKRFYIYI